MKLLHAGPVQVQYENGFLRYITVAGQEVVRLIYFAVRDQDWNTIPGTIQDETITHTTDNFEIAYRFHVNQGDIRMEWQVRITGFANGMLSYQIRGIVLHSFLKNRLGLCVLHPIEGTARQSCQVFHTDGRFSEAKFPELISPDTPFKDMQALQWQDSLGGVFRLDFEGDVFETEDQRNWTDASYKTYCTPLEWPFPVAVTTGTEINQQVTFSILHLPPLSAKLIADDSILLIKQISEPVPFPEVGLEMNVEQQKFTSEEAPFLAQAGFSHLRADLFLSQPAWKQVLTQALEQCKQLKLSLELAVFFGNDPAQEAKQLVEASRQNDNAIKTILIFEEKSRLTTSLLLEAVLPTIRSRFAHTPTGGGTDANFAEFNRLPLDYARLDFVTYSINPQVHAFDDLSLVENCSAQADTVRSAQTLSTHKPVHISPVTLKPRFNAVATSGSTSSLPPADPRQATAFTAAWTLGSLKYLSETGAASVTYFETTGSRGICTQGDVFPVGRLLEVLLQFRPLEVLPTACSQPLQVSSLLLKNKEQTLLLLANHTINEKVVQLPAGWKVGQTINIVEAHSPWNRESSTGQTNVRIPALAVIGMYLIRH
jgi:hypothetical protein